MFIGKGYGEIVLNDTLQNAERDINSGYVTALFYGVIEKSAEFDFAIAALTESNPKKPVKTLLKMGFYLMKYMKKPPYAVIDKVVRLSVTVGKGGVKGFINAVLRKYPEWSYPAREQCGAVKYLSYTYSCPQWLTQKLISQRGEGFTERFLAHQSDQRPHIRFNERMMTREEFEVLLKKVDPSAQKTALGWYADYAGVTKLKASSYTVMSLSSMLAVKCYVEGLPDGASVLDLCAAPGGKAVYMSELTNAKITAADIHPHRVELIKSYAERMGAKLTATTMDAGQYQKELDSAFDCVVCDVPCSGIGVIKQRPDILIHRQDGDEKSLAGTAARILNNAARYVKVGGRLCYSTCTILKEENENVIEAFLKSRADYQILPVATPYAQSDKSGFVNIFPGEGADEGFFIAILTRVG